jgi:hypothetical protein
MLEPELDMCGEGSTTTRNFYIGLETLEANRGKGAGLRKMESALMRFLERKPVAAAQTLLARAAPIDVVMPDDVIVIEVGPGLDLDEKGGDLARIGEAVLLADFRQKGSSNHFHDQDISHIRPLSSHVADRKSPCFGEVKPEPCHPKGRARPGLFPIFLELGGYR